MMRTILQKIALFSPPLLSMWFLAPQAQAEGRLMFYCTVQNKACEAVAQRFAKKYDVETSFIHGSTGTILGRLKAEKANPQADVWYGGTIEPHFQAGEQGLLEAYRPKNQANIRPDLKALIGQKGDFTSITYALVLGFGYNSEKLQQLGVEPPKKWDDLLNPKLKGEVQLPDPRSSGTTYTIIATLVQLWGEEKAFEYLKKLNENVSQYVKSNLVTANLSRGESAVSIGFVHGYESEKEKGAKVEAVVPEGLVGYALGGTSIVKNARNLDNAKLFADFVLSKEIQELAWKEFQYYQIPSTVDAEVSPKSVNLSQYQLLPFDFDKFGSSEEAKRLIDKWLAEIKLSK